MFKHSARIPEGHMIITDVEGNMNIADTHQCCHCGCHFVVVAGSGRTRGFCTLCNHVTCGSPECNQHFPFEKKLDLFEKGKINKI